MRYRSTLRRRKLTPKQQRLYKQSEVAQLRASVLGVGLAKHFERVYDIEELDRLTDIILMNLRPALAEAEKFRAEMDRTRPSPRKTTRNPR